MKKILLSFILMVAGIGMASAGEPVMGIVCSYAGQEAFFPLSDSPQVKYENKDGVQHVVVLVGGVEKLSVALVDGGTLAVSYDSRALHEHNYAEAWSSDETNHWHACTGEGECDAPKSDEAAHSYGEVATETAYYTCSVCKYENVTRKAEYEAAVKAAADQAAVDAVVTKINAIGTVEYTEACKALIDEARAAYDALTDDQKALVTAEQLKVLTDAEAAYAELKAAAEKAAADQAAADAVVEKINAIGTVEYTEACKALIDEARAAYDALTDDQKALITADQLKVLTDAEAAYAELKAAAEKAAADQAAADAVVEKINAIGTVEYTEACKELIDAAREAYDALTDDQKALITAEQLKVLTDAEAEYERLKDIATGIAGVNVTSAQKDGKYIKNGKVYIVKNGKLYDANGNRIK